jgi:L-rhamnose-H+ transport protein
MQTNPLLGIVFHGIGAASSSSCYTPQKQTKLWAWEAYWFATALFAWLILPMIGAFLTIPHYLDILRSLPAGVMLKSFGLGVIYGIGGMTFGLGIRYIGFSLNYAIAIGLSAALGTLFPLVWNPNDGFVWQIVEKFSNGPGLIILAGILISFVGIFVCGWAGALREGGKQGDESRKYNLRAGLPLAMMAGVLSAIFNYALLAGAPIEKAAVANGASVLLKMNAIYPFSHGGAFATNCLGCLIFFRRNGTGSQLFKLPGGAGGGKLAFYWLMAALSGTFWYFQFFFYGMGHFHMGERFGFTSWALHMAMLILFSNMYGFLFKEWAGADKHPKRVLHLGMLFIVIACALIGYGNYRGESEARPHGAAPAQSDGTGH